VTPTGGNYTFSIDDGELPAGLILDGDTGEISGTPTDAGSSEFAIRATGPGGCSGDATFTMRVWTPSTMCNQYFDSLAAPSLPIEWVSTGAGSFLPWVTSPNNSDTPMNAVFAASMPEAGFSELTTPAYFVSPGGAQMTFRNSFNFEDGFDGMVLEVSINGAAFQDIVAAGGSFVTGGYNRAISSSFGSPISGRNAWSGLSGGTESIPAYLTTTVNMPVSSYGQSVKMRWVAASDNSLTAAGDAGARIDTIIGTACITTAAGVEVSGRVLTPEGRGLMGAAVSITDSSGRTREARTGSFGYYRFNDIETGRTYTLRVESRRFSFATIVINVFDSLTDVNFVGLE
jgi:hypothetical protein